MEALGEQDIPKLLALHGDPAKVVFRLSMNGENELHVAAEPQQKLITQFELPSGTIRPGSRFYVERKADRILEEQILMPGTTVRVKGSRQTGKSSLLVRGKQLIDDHQREALYVDFQVLEKDLWKDLDRFLRRLADLIARHFKTESPDSYWSRPFGPKMNLSDFVRDCVLAKMASPVVLMLDEVDRLFGSPCQDEFFSLLRVWHNNRAVDDVWNYLNLVLAYAAEEHLFIRDINQSPFNVGLVIEMADFDEVLVREMNDRYGGVATEEDFRRLTDLVGGHPYLLNLAFYTLATRQWAVDRLLAVAVDEDGPFGAHLHDCLVRLRRQPRLCEAMKEVIRDHTCSEDDLFYQLRTAGLIIGHGNRQARPRCGLYKEYFRRHL